MLMVWVHMLLYGCANGIDFPMDGWVSSLVLCAKVEMNGVLEAALST